MKQERNKDQTTEVVTLNSLTTEKENLNIIEKIMNSIANYKDTLYLKELNRLRIDDTYFKDNQRLATKEISEKIKRLLEVAFVEKGMEEFVITDVTELLLPVHTNLSLEGICSSKKTHSGFGRLKKLYTALEETPMQKKLLSDVFLAMIQNIDTERYTVRTTYLTSTFGNKKIGILRISEKHKNKGY